MFCLGKSMGAVLHSLEWRTAVVRWVNSALASEICYLSSLSGLGDPLSERENQDK